MTGESIVRRRSSPHKRRDPVKELQARGLENDLVSAGDTFEQEQKSPEEAQHPEKVLSFAAFDPFRPPLCLKRTHKKNARRKQLAANANDLSNGS